MTELDWSGVNRGLREAAQRAVDAGDWECVAIILDDPLGFVLHNVESLLAVGDYENALLHAFVVKDSHPLFPVKTLDWMFARADRARMMQLSTCELPPEDPKATMTGFGQRFGARLEVFRGVSGADARDRHVGGWGWTLDREAAERYACRFGLPDPAVYKASLRRDRVYCVLRNQWGGVDVIARPRWPIRIPFSGDAETRENWVLHYNMRRRIGRGGPHSS